MTRPLSANGYWHGAVPAGLVELPKVFGRKHTHTRPREPKACVKESAGIATSDGDKVYKHLGMGLVSDVFNETVLDNLPGHIAIGHNRYSTTGSSNEQNIGPIVVNHRLGTIGVAHNGNLVNSNTLKEMLENRGSIFQTTTDSEVILHLVAKSKKETIE